ncbi:putative ribonuclease H-like domain-containing protein [Tanacetum coccineum]
MGVLQHTQEEGINYDEVFAPVARIEAIRLFLAYASFMGFMVYQMDVKSVFLYGRIEEGKIDQTLFIKKQKGDILLVQVYVDKIIFGSTKKEFCTEFEKLMHDKFQMSSMGELTFFLGFQVKQKEDGIFISQDKYVADILRKFSFTDVRTASTPMDTEKPLLKDSDGDDVDVHLYRSMIGSLMYLTSSRPDIIDSSFDLVAYSDSDYAGASLDRKSTTGGCQFLGCRLISWQCKKQTVVATSSTEAEYVAAASCCGQVLWIQNQMLDYGISKAVWLDLVIPIVEFVREKKPEGSEGFHQIVDFLNANHIRYALIENPTIYVSLIKHFWETATARTLDNREIELNATIDGKVVTPPNWVAAEYGSGACYFSDQ